MLSCEGQYILYNSHNVFPNYFDRDEKEQLSIKTMPN